VLGGLDPVDAAEFRVHLTGCRDCRRRVAELRAIATDMAAAEREERAASRLQTEVARRTEQVDGEDEGSSRPPGTRGRGIGVGAVAAGLVLLVGLLLWNFHLRDVNAQLVQVTATREAILELLATGSPAPLIGEPRVQGQVVVADWQVAVDLAGIPAFAGDEVLVTWLLASDGTATHRFEPLASPRVVDGLLALRGEHHGAATLVVSIEQVPLRADQDGPAGDRLLVADLAAARGAG
jgi:anti-sigma factor RsiW